MKINFLVGFALFLVLFLTASIFLITFLKTPLFLYIYFIFAFLFLIAISFILKKQFPEEINFSFLIIMIIFIAVALTFFGSSIKNYYDKNKEITGSLDPSFQIESIMKTNEYYLSYINFINDEILKTKQVTLDLQSQLDKLISQQKAAADQINAPAPEANQDNIPIIIREREEEEDD